MGSVRPVRRFDALRALADRDLPSRPKPDGGPPRAFAPVQRSIAALPHRPADRSRHVERCFLPWAFEPYDTCETADPHSAGLPAPLRAASGVWLPPSRRSPPFLATPCGAAASIGFPLQGVLPAPIGTPLGAPCPRGVARVDSPRPPGERADAVDFRASIPARIRSATAPLRARPVVAFLGFTLQSVLPLRPGARLWFAGPPLTRAAAVRHQHRLRRRVFWSEGVGLPLSGLPALLGFLTLRPSRGRSDRTAGRVHGFTSRLARRVRSEPI